MLPPGKYVVEVIMPPGYEVYKEEDKNLLIGDNYIAPATVQFGGLGGDIFIIPDQASVASLYDPTASGYNPTNFQDSTTSLGLSEHLSGVPAFPGFIRTLSGRAWVNARGRPTPLASSHRLKKLLHSPEPLRPICDRKEVALADQMNVSPSSTSSPRRISPRNTPG